MSIFDPYIFRAYDMRGTYPTQMTEAAAYAAGQAFVHVMKAKNVVVGRDVRLSGPSIAEALMQGVVDAGANVINVGVISTEMLYYAAAKLDCDGGMSVTASHLPGQWNGIKFIEKGAIPLARDGKLGEIYDFINAGHKISEFEKGTIREENIIDGYAELMQTFIAKDMPHLKIVGNASFGANGKLVDAVLKGTDVEMIKINWNEDGHFPKGAPDPLLPVNQVEICDRIVSESAHFGVAWDADADRAFFYDEKGRFFNGYYITALLIKYFLQKEHGANVIGERRLIWANQAAAKNGGGQLVFSQTGHGYIKMAMRENNAIFGGEMSGHFYYRDYFYCDSGMVTFLAIMSVFAEEIKNGGTVSGLLDAYLSEYPTSRQEFNYITPKAEEIMKAASEKYADAEQNHLDGLTVDYPHFHINLRMSSNEPVLRLNYEAHTQEDLATYGKEIEDFITSFGATLRDDTHA